MGGEPASLASLASTASLGCRFGYGRGVKPANLPSGCWTKVKQPP